MGRTRHLNATMTVFNESLPGWGYWRHDRGISVRYGFFMFNQARTRGDVLRFEVSGADAEKAMQVIREHLKKPKDRIETAKLAMGFMFGGRDE